MAICLFKNSKIAESNFFINKIEEPLIKGNVYNNLSNYLLIKNQKKKSLDLLEKSKNSTFILKDLEEGMQTNRHSYFLNISLLLEIADNYSKLGFKEKLSASS